MKHRLASLALVFGLSAVAAAQAVPPADLDARVTRADGVATLYLPDGADQGLPVEVGAPLSAKDRIVTGADGRVELGFDGNSVVELGPNSDMTVSSLQRKSSSFTLSVGSLFAKIKAGLFGEGQLEVRSAGVVAAVRGTEFAVELSQDRAAQIGVFDEGKVGVKGEAGEEVLLVHNQETLVLPGKAPNVPGPLDRFAARREIIARLRQRAETLRARWKELSAADRAKARERLRERLRERRELRRERRQERRQRRQERRVVPRQDR